MRELTKHEELILLSIWRLKDNAYGVTIRKKILEITEKTINYGSLCNTLYLLVRRGFIIPGDSDPESVQGGRRKVLYNLTPEGKKALITAYEVQKSTWNGFSELAFEE
ncbi:MAG: hypothetical protein GY863_24815 [bacterium]|nr:hypothetical protein [bacterium]